MEQAAKQTETIFDQYRHLLDNEPKFITNYVPANAKDEKEKFLSGQIDIPDHNYPSLDAINFSEVAAQIERDGGVLIANPDLSKHYTDAYEDFTRNYLAKTRLMQLAHEYKLAENETERSNIGREYMALNIELYGEPDRQTYRSLLGEKLSNLAGKELNDDAAVIRAELFSMIDFDPTTDTPERFSPSTETVEWMHGVVEALYDGMLSHVPDKEQFDVNELKTIFQAILTEEYGDAAAGWRVDIELATSVNVKPTESRIVIPEDRGILSRATVRNLVVHEIGLHVFRSISGAQTDFDALRYGLSEYNDTEEGLGIVMEQALSGKYAERGIEHYITAGLGYIDGKSFRESFEIKWRMSLLSQLKDGDVPGEVSIAKAKDSAYKGLMRIYRGTDSLPWFKDLAYYNGSAEVWKYLEENRGDDLRLALLLQGKVNTSHAHLQTVLEVHSV